MEKKESLGFLGPLVGLVIVIAAVYALVRSNLLHVDILSPDTWYEHINPILPKIFVILMLFFIFRLALSLFNYFSTRFSPFFLRKKKASNLRKLFGFGWWFVFAIVSASILFGNLSGIITSVGLVGLGLTFALQKPILNFVGWLTIILQDIYNEGDRIQIGQTRGDVKEIQVMNTIVSGILSNSDMGSNKTIAIPNEMVLTTMVENFTRESNYIRTELVISITYESNYHKSMKLLDRIVRLQIKKNIKQYIKEKRSLGYPFGHILARLKQHKPPIVKDQPTGIRDIAAIQKEIDKGIQEEIDLEEEFRPWIRIELAASSIELIAQFLSPYNEIKKNKTEINLAFLDALQNEKDIEVAYPHMELVYKPKSTETP